MLFLPISLITQVRLFHLSISGDKKVEFEKQKKGIFRKLIRRFLVNWIYFHAIYESAFFVFGDKGSCVLFQTNSRLLKVQHVIFLFVMRFSNVVSVSVCRYDTYTADFSLQ